MRLQLDTVHVLKLLTDYSSFDEVVLAAKLGALDGPWDVRVEHHPPILVRFKRKGFWSVSILLLWRDMRVGSGLGAILGSHPRDALQNHLESGGSL